MPLVSCSGIRRDQIKTPGVPYSRPGGCKQVGAGFYYVALQGSKSRGIAALPRAHAHTLHTSPFVLALGGPIGCLESLRYTLRRDAPPFEDPENARLRTGASLRNRQAEANAEVTGTLPRHPRNLTVRNGTTVP